MSWIELEPLLGYAGILAILAISLNVICGLTGMLQLGHAGFFAAGAYAAGLLSIYATIPELGPLNLALSLMAGMAAASVFSVLIGLPCLRLRGDYLAIATLAFGEILRLVLETLTFPGGRMFAGREKIGGPTGIHFTETPGDLWPEHPNYSAGYARWWIIWLAVLAIYILLRNLKFSRAGRAFQCIREDEIAARAMGIDVPRHKLLAFGVSAAFAGLAGALFFHHQLRVNPNDFQLLTSIEVLLMVVLGGMGSLSGSLLAAVLLGLLPQGLRHGVSLLREHWPALAGWVRPEEYHQVLYALLLILLIRLAPNGLLGQNELPGWLRSRLLRSADGGSEGKAAK